MKLYHLIYFKKVSDVKSISRAAEELGITQPAVSKQIKALEEDLGERLFDRIGKKVFLTKAGEVLHAHADRILGAVQDAKNAVRDISAECSGELIIGTSDHISLHRLPDVLKSYIASYPKVDLKLRCHRSETILKMVHSNSVDLGVITLPLHTQKLTLKKIWDDPMSLVYPKAHPLRNLGEVKLKDIVPYGLILPEPDTMTRKTIEEVFYRKKLMPNISMEVAYIETIKGLVKAGLGISILPDKAVEHEIKSGELKRAKILDAEFSRNLGVVHLRDKLLSRPAKEFLMILEDSS